MNLKQLTNQCLAKMRLGGLAPQFGTDPRTPEDAVLQVEVYLSAIRTKVKVEPSVLAEVIATAADRLIATASKFPSASEFAAVCEAVALEWWMLIALPEPDGGVVAQRVLKSTTQADLAAMVAQAQAALPPPEPRRSLEEARQIVDMRLDRKKEPSEPTVTEDDLKRRDAQVKLLREGA